MNVNTDHLRTVEPATADELEEMHTGSLLTRLKKLRGLHDCFEKSDWLVEERDAAARAGLIAFKDQEIWKTAFDDVKSVLAKREHLPRGSKEKRQDAAREKQNR